MDADRYLPRPIRDSVALALTDTPVVCLLGPRQVGKSTLTRRVEPDRDYYDLDNEALFKVASEDPAGFIDTLPEKVTLDEIQRLPELMRAIKISVDRNRKPGRFLLTGSANFLLLPRLSESLAGRIEILDLHPLTEAEKEESPGKFLEVFLENRFVPAIKEVVPRKDIMHRMLQGGYPEVIGRTPARVQQWHRQYLQTLFERDVHDIANVRNIAELSRLLEVLAHQGASLLNLSNVSRDLKISRPTTDHYLQVLKRLFLVREFPAWHKNRAKRLVKSPKIHLRDCGLAATLMDLDGDSWNTRREEFGALLESFVIQQLTAQAAWTDPRLKLFHYRDRDQVEVDCVVTCGTKVWGIEVKLSSSVSRSDTKGLKRLAEQAGDDFQGGAILYNGESTVRLGDEKLMAIPLAKLWEI